MGGFHHWEVQCCWLKGLCVALFRHPSEGGGLEDLEKTGFTPPRKWREGDFAQDEKA